jgi:hypothetical protein
VQEYQTVIATTRFEQGQVSGIRLYPVFLGTSADRDADHVAPHLESPAMAQTILENLQQLSKPFGTVILLENNVGIIRVPPAATQRR